MAKIPYGRQFIDQNDIDEVVRVLKSDMLTQGPEVERFEANFANYVGAKYAVAVANGTAALHLSAMALNVHPGQKVITTPITFSASANAIKYCGGEVVFSDIDAKTLLLDLPKLKALLEASPKGTFSGIVCVDFAGYPTHLAKLRKLADEFGLWIIEDACHAPGSWFLDEDGEKHMAGGSEFAELAIFSFHPVKHIAAGEGGMVTTNSKELYERIKRLRTHGITKDTHLLNENHGEWYYELQELGYNYRLTDFQAALGNSQLKKMEWNLSRRQQLAQKYDQAFAKLDLTLPYRNRSVFHAFHLYIIQIDRRKELYDFLKTNGIFAQVHYVPVHLMPLYQKDGWQKGDFPVAENYYEKCLSLPMFPSLTEEEQGFVIQKVIEFCS